MNYKAVFCDIDGTLLATDKSLSAANIAAVRSLTSKGIPFILVSSRMPKGMADTISGLGISAPIIAGGGSLILDAAGHTLYETGFSADEAAAIRKALPRMNPDFVAATYSGMHWICEDAGHPEIIKEAQITNVVCEEGDPGELLPADALIQKMLCFGKPSVLDETASRLAPLFPYAFFVKSAPHLLEFNPRTCSKSNAIRLLCEKLGINPAECIAFGDNFNDIDMLKAVGLSVAMGNAVDEVKKTADCVTDTNDRDGVAKKLMELFELKEDESFVS